MNIEDNFNTIAGLSNDVEGFQNTLLKDNLSKLTNTDILIYYLFREYATKECIKERLKDFDLSIEELNQKKKELHRILNKSSQMKTEFFNGDINVN